ncbi:hypothetical protein ACFQES_48215 [Nonomuraea salmonea]|uniref:hypothetical protein n=1 Tax=Nonomuraea salmonea TaxID=46181 RepID=UPI003605CF06
MITIHVSPEQGIVLTGAGPDHHNLLGDRDHGGLGLTWSEHDGRKGAWYEPHSRHKPLAQHRARIAEIAATLRAAGSPVTIDVSGTASRPTRKAKTGHRPYWVTRTRIAEHLQQHRRDPRATLRRIQRLQEQLRHIDRALNGQAYPQPVEHDGEPVLAEDGRPLLQWHPATGDHRDRLQHDQARLQARIAYWQTSSPRRPNKASRSGVRRIFSPETSSCTSAPGARCSA